MSTNPDRALPLRPTRGVYRFERMLQLPVPAERLFAFFSDAFNLEQITPPFLRFRVLTPGPIAMAPGLRIDYALRLHGLPLRWQSEITAWDPPHRFADVQVRGPYRWWRHEHRFEPSARGSTVVDEVEYAVRGGALVHLFVRRDLRRIFDYRQRRLLELFAPGSAAAA